ncbi:hypothetical protein BN1864_LIB5394:06105 [Pseudomonas sp. 1 R 17]|jgi:hypothetical protein|nr:hypothetical protein BN1864_LIB5394:06105 [Pseudomonas sp. 1 R 17]
MITTHLKNYFRLIKLGKKLRSKESYKILITYRNSVEDNIRDVLKEIESTQPHKLRKALFKSVKARAEEYTPLAMNLARLNSSKLEIDNAILDYKYLYLMNPVKQRALIYNYDLLNLLKLQTTFVLLTIILIIAAVNHFDKIIAWIIASVVFIYTLQMKSNRTTCEIKNAIIDTNKQHKK